MTNYLADVSIFPLISFIQQKLVWSHPYCFPLCLFSVARRIDFIDAKRLLVGKVNFLKVLAKVYSLDNKQVDVFIF